MRIRSLSPVRRTATVMIAVLAGVTLCVSAVTVVSAASRAKSYHACANGKHALALLSHGHCAKHFHQVSIGAPAAAPSKVYVATGLVALESPAVARRAPDDPTLSAVTLSLPAGHYLVAWQVLISGSKVVTGTPGGQQYNLELSCEPTADAGGTTTSGDPDLETSTLTPDDYDSQNNMSHFDFYRDLSSIWALSVPSGGAHVSVVCAAPELTDGNGNQTTTDTSLAGGQITASSVEAVHGSDDGSDVLSRR